MQRRQFITSASATVAAASLAGCSGILGGGGGGGSSGPEGPVEAYVDAVNDNDAEAMQAVFHPDGEESDGDTSDSDLEGVSMSIESIETLEESDDQATVDAEIDVTIAMGEEEVSETLMIEFDVRKYEGDWMIYATSTGSSGEN